MISWLKNQSLRRLLLVVAVVALVVLTAVAWLIDPDNRERLRQAFHQQNSQAQADPMPQPAPADKNAGNSDAERITRLHRLIEVDEKQLAYAKQRLAAPDSEYKRAETGFREIDGRLASKLWEVKKLRQAGKTAEADALDKSLEPLKKQRNEARDRFDLAFQARKTLQERVSTLPAKIEREKKALEKLEGPHAHDHGSEESSQLKEPAVPSEPRKENAATAGEPGKAPKTAAAVSPAGKPPANPASEERAEAVRTNKKLKQATERASKTADAARTARERVETLSAWLDSLRLQILQEQQLLDIARKTAAAARQRKGGLEQELQQRTVAGAPATELAELRKKIDDEGALIEQSDADALSGADTLIEHQASLDRGQSKRAEAEKEAEKAEKEAERAEKKVAELQNPFTPHNVLQWFLDHGPRLLVILLGMLVLHRLVSLSSRRIVRLMTHSNRKAERLDEEDRAETLVGVFRNTASLLILGGGVLMLLDEVGIPVVPLMGGAAVFGLAVAFGAQNLIKDYFSGFMVLLEDQYAVNDVIRIGPIEGKVERISLRITVLRDVTGVVHFIPHGTITTVSNLTHGFSRAFFEIGIAYKEDADRVMALLEELARDLRADPEFGPLILEDSEMLGVDALGESSVLIKFYLDTKPLKQGTVRRELLRRIKR
ncbi:MAG: mechanosensitive ion channel, partial [Planctomycetes bacterium]|nr:mechanosensitive ion channel [Planctomycetota bacterium]